MNCAIGNESLNRQKLTIGPYLGTAEDNPQPSGLRFCNFSFTFLSIWPPSSFCAPEFLCMLCFRHLCCVVCPSQLFLSFNYSYFHSSDFSSVWGPAVQLSTVIRLEYQLLPESLRQNLAPVQSSGYL